MLDRSVLPSPAERQSGPKSYSLTTAAVVPGCEPFETIRLPVPWRKQCVVRHYRGADPATPRRIPKSFAGHGYRAGLRSSGRVLVAGQATRAAHLRCEMPQQNTWHAGSTYLYTCSLARRARPLNWGEHRRGRVLIAFTQRYLIGNGLVRM